MSFLKITHASQTCVSLFAKTTLQSFYHSFAMTDRIKEPYYAPLTDRQLLPPHHLFILSLSDNDQECTPA
jgi:hypothetical protein